MIVFMILLPCVYNVLRLLIQYGDLKIFGGPCGNAETYLLDLEHVCINGVQCDGMVRGAMVLAFAMLGLNNATVRLTAGTAV